jgi:epoxyqueuosine reductase QueG
MEDVRSIVVVGVPILNGSLEPLPQGRAEYTNSLLASTVTLRFICYDLARRLERDGHRATIVPAEGSEFGYWYVDRDVLKADFSIRYAAYLAGLGQYDLSQNIITHKFGPRVRFMAIMTDALLETKEHPPLGTTHR